MRIILNYRKKNQRLEEALKELGHSVIYNLWDIGQIESYNADAVIFEFKNILKHELKFLRASYELKRANIPMVTWCLDMPNIGARRWKLSLILKAKMVDIFATHSMQELKSSKVHILYLPNAAWMSRYNPGNITLEDLRIPDRYTTDVSFIGNINSEVYPEHRHRTEFLESLAELLLQEGIQYRFEDGSCLDYNSQIAIIQKSRINITFGCGADRYGKKSWGLPERCYGIPACGGFLLSDERRHAGDDFIEGEEIVTFKDLNDCFNKIKYYIKHFEQARKIAENAYKRVVHEHTYKHRALKLVEAIKSIKESTG